MLDYIVPSPKHQAQKSLSPLPIITIFNYKSKIPMATTTAAERTPPTRAFRKAPLVELLVDLDEEEAVVAEAEAEAEAELESEAFLDSFSAARSEQSETRVVLLVIVSNLVWAVAALAWKSAIFVALFLNFLSSLVVFAARAMVSWRSSILLQADIVAQVETRVVLDSIVDKVLAAAEALAWMVAILVSLFLVSASSLVVFEANFIKLWRFSISLQRALVEVLLVEFPFAATAVERMRVRKMLVICILAVEGFRRIKELIDKLEKGIMKRTGRGMKENRELRRSEDDEMMSRCPSNNGTM